MEKAKTTKSATTKAPAKKVDAKKAPAKVTKKPVASEVQVKKVEETPVSEVKTPAKVEKKPIMFNQDLNLLIGFISLLTMLTLCFEFQGGSEGVLGWELFLKGGAYSGVFKGVMILFVISLFVDCLLAVRMDVHHDIANVIEKSLYMVTLVLNIMVVAILYSLISKVGIGLIILLILSIVSVLIKLGRIYTQSK